MSDSHADAPPAIRAGILVTGTEVLTGIISDRNGPWLSERLREIGVDAAMIQIVGDRPEDLLAALRYMRDEGMALIVTSGGLGPTADDLTAEIVGRFAGREMVLDDELEERIAEILRPLMRRWPGLDQRGDPRLQPQAGGDPAGRDDARAGRHRARPGRAAGRRRRARRWWCCPGRRASFSRCGRRPAPTDAFRAAIAGATTYVTGIVRLFGIPESEIANTLRAAEDEGLTLDDARDHHLPAARRDRGRRPATSRRPRTTTTRCRSSSPTATATRCSPRRLDRRRAGDRAACGAHGRGRRVVHRRPAVGAADRPRRLLGVLPRRRRGVLERGQGRSSPASTPTLIERSARSRPRSPRRSPTALRPVSAPTSGSASPASPGPAAAPRRSRSGSCASRSVLRDGERITRSTRLPGNRADVRDRSTTVAMHLLRRLLTGEASAAA